MNFSTKATRLIGFIVTISLGVTYGESVIADDSMCRDGVVEELSLQQPSSNAGITLISEDDSERFTEEIETLDVEADTLAEISVRELAGEAEVIVYENGALEIEASAVIDGVEKEDCFIVVELTTLDVVGDNFTATLRSAQTGETVYINTEMATAQALPIVAVLAAVARFGIKYAVKWYGKTQIKKSAKSYMLNNLNANKWKHIMAGKHKWNSVGAKTKEHVAEITSKAMVEGTHVKVPGRPTEMRARYKYKGKTVVVQYSKKNRKNRGCVGGINERHRYSNS